MTPELSKKIDAAIVAKRDTGMSFGDVAAEVNVLFNTTLSRSAVIARYNRAMGRRYPNVTRREARESKLPYPRKQPTYKANDPIDPVRYAQAELDAKAYRKIAKGDIFTLKPDMHYCTITELRDGTCRWPLNAPNDERVFYCGEGSRDGNTYCPFHHRVAHS